MFPLHSEIPYIKENGTRSTLGEMLDQEAGDISDLETRIDTAEDDIDSLETRVDTAEDDIDSLETRMTTAEGDIDSLETRMTTAEGDIDSLEDDVLDLQDVISDAYDSEASYSVGDYFIYGDTIYEVITACTGITPPNSEYYTAHTVTDLVTTLNSSLTISVSSVTSESSHVTLGDVQLQKYGKIYSLTGYFSVDTAGTYTVFTNLPKPKIKTRQACITGNTNADFVALGIIILSTDGTLTIEAFATTWIYQFNFMWLSDD